MSINNKKFYPLNVAGIVELGAKQWFDTYYLPVSGQEFKAIYDTVLEKYLHIFAHTSLTEQDYWLATSNIASAIWIARGIIHSLRQQRLLEAQFEHVFIDKVQPIENLTTAYPASPLTSLFMETSKSKLLKSYVALFGSFATKTITAQQKTLMLGNYQQAEATWYCNQNNIAPINLSNHLFASLLPTNTNNVNDNLVAKTKEFINWIKDQYAFLSPKWEEHFYKNMLAHWALSTSFFKNSYRVFTKMPSVRNLIATSLSPPINRVILSACRMANKNVYGLSHGNTFAYAYEAGYLPDVISIATHVIASSKGEAQLFSELVKDHSQGLKMAQPMAPAQSRYLPLFEKLQTDTPPVSQIQKVLIMGFPLTANFYTYIPSHHAFSNLHLEIRLAQLLKSQGYHVSYKAHPEKLAEAQILFKDYADTIISNSFEETYHQIDCVIFPYARTSTFGFALLTNKPIVLINLNDVMWHPNVIPLLQKRCKVIPATADSEDRILFDEQAFLDAVQSAHQNIDYQLIHDFAL